MVNAFLSIEATEPATTINAIRRLRRVLRATAFGQSTGGAHFGSLTNVSKERGARLVAYYPIGIFRIEIRITGGSPIHQPVQWESSSSSSEWVISSWSLAKLICTETTFGNILLLSIGSIAAFCAQFVAKIIDSCQYTLFICNHKECIVRRLTTCDDNELESLNYRIPYQ